MPSPKNSPSAIPFFPYRLFFLYVEPIASLVGAYYAAFRPVEYLAMLTFSSVSSPGPGPFSTETHMALAQLGNLYLVFALFERFVLAGAPSTTTWRHLLLCMLIADFGHLATMAPLGAGVYWRVWEWNAMCWGSLGFVYLGAALRTCFLLGIGLGS